MKINIREAIKLSNMRFYKYLRELGAGYDCIVRKSDKYIILYPNQNKVYKKPEDIINEIVGEDVTYIIKNKIEFIDWRITEEGTATHVRFKFVAGDK
jgi:hypothetical protein